MKKIIAAAVGLMIAGTAMVASAAVELSGDARARYFYNDNIAVNGVQEDHWNNRVRLMARGTTAGGSYAVIRVRANNASWGDADADRGRGDVVYDRAYVGTDFGCINIEAGRNDYGITTGFWNDVNLDLIKATYNMNDTTLMSTYSVSANNRGVNQSEDRLITLGWIQGWDAWNTTAALAVVNADFADTTNPAGSNIPFNWAGDLVDWRGQSDENTGVMATIGASGPIGPVALAFELGWQQDGFVATDTVRQGYDFTGDDGFGGYLTAGMDFDALNLTFAAGFALDGYVWDLPVGFTMLGGDKIITPGIFDNLGAINLSGTGAAAANPATYDANGNLISGLPNGDVATDTYWAGLIGAYQMNEQLGFTFDLAYANVEPVDTDFDHDAFEVAGRASYAVNDGTMLHVEMGYLNIDGDLIDSDMFAGAVSLELSF